MRAGCIAATSSGRRAAGVSNVRYLIGSLVAIIATLAHAHKPSDSYLSLDQQGALIQGQWDIAIRDLDVVLDLDSDGDRAITWGELRKRKLDIDAYALRRLRIEADDEPCNLIAGALLVDDHTDGSYAVLRFTAECPGAPSELRVNYQLLFDVDAQHKGLLSLTSAGRTRSHVFSADAPGLDLRLAEPGRLRQFGTFVREGVWHIWVGFDHLLFLVSLLLPAVLTRHGARWCAAPSLGVAMRETARVVTAFTAAHSITLSLATFDMLSLPARPVEATIAASVVLVALNNVWPVVEGRRWVVAFLFGLVHGFGFAAVLSDLGLPRDALLLALFGFNAGVELGQLAIVGAVLPVIWWSRDRLAYRQVVLSAGSLLVAAIAAVWFVERAFDVHFPGWGS